MLLTPRGAVMGVSTRVAAVAVTAAAALSACGGSHPAPTVTVAAPPSSPSSSASPVPPGPRSTLLNIALPADAVSSLGANPKPGVESWDFTSSYDDAVQLLASELPLGQPYKGLPFCVNHQSEAAKKQVMRFEWSDGTTAVRVSVKPSGSIFSVKPVNTIFISYGPDDEEPYLRGCQ
jgi:hypothetical protein